MNYNEKQEAMTSILEAIKAKGYDSHSAYVYFFGLATATLTDAQVKEIQKVLKVI